MLARGAIGDIVAGGAREIERAHASPRTPPPPRRHARAFAVLTLKGWAGVCVQAGMRRE